MWTVRLVASEWSVVVSFMSNASLREKKLQMNGGVYAYRVERRRRASLCIGNLPGGAG